jgi:hypothetical protein
MTAAEKKKKKKRKKKKIYTEAEKMSQAEDPRRLPRAQGAHAVTVEDVRQLMGASTPHFALQLRNRIAKLIADLPPDHPARVAGEREIARLEQLGFDGELRGEPSLPGGIDLRPLPSLALRGDEPVPVAPA